MTATIIIPLKNGLPEFQELCRAIETQVYRPAPRVICIDSGSTDGSIACAEAAGFEVIKIPPEDFGHGKTRNMGAALAQTEYVVFLTQDAIPDDDQWLSMLLAPLEADPKAAGCFSRHIAHHLADPFTRADIDQHFDALAAFERVEITDRAAYDANEGLRQMFHFFSDNASALRRSVWERYPFEHVDFAEDQLWAKTILEAGYRKAYAPRSVVRHSHSFGPWDSFRRAFDESRAFQRLFGYHLCGSLGRALVSGAGLFANDARRAWRFGWWRSHPAACLRRGLCDFARPKGRAGAMGTGIAPRALQTVHHPCPLFRR
jgi:rhamnosyltransferase